MIIKTKELTQISLIRALEYTDNILLNQKRRRASAVDFCIKFKLLIKLTVYRNQ